MKCAEKKMRSPLKWHGGKSYLARRIVALFPPHRRYVEPFAGGLSVLLNKPKAEQEIASDLDDGLVNFWKELRATAAFVHLVLPEAYNRQAFDAAMPHLSAENSVIRAAAFLIRNRFSRGGMGKDFAWSDRLRGGQPGDVNGWETIKAELPAIRERVKDVAFYSRPAADVMRDYDSPDTLFYLDPPYMPATRTAKAVYAHEMTPGDHEKLLSAAAALFGKAFISGYSCPLYNDTLAAWTRHEFSMPNHSGQGKTKQRRVECVWENHP